MSNNLLSMHVIPMHMRPQDLAYAKVLRPNIIKLIDASPEQVRQYHAEAPEATIFLRDHPMSEQHDDMVNDPEATGKRHASDWFSRINNYNLPLDRIIVSGINEPKVWSHLTQTVRYTVAFLDACTRLGLSATALNLSVGWPANNGDATLPDWTPYTPVHAAIKRGIGHVLCVHEYFDHNGPHYNWGWWCGRVLNNPWDVPIVIGEAGLDEYVGNPSVGQDRRGWQAHMAPAIYATALREYCQRMAADARVIAVCPFTTDFAGREWRTFDTEPAQWDLGKIFVKAGDGYKNATSTPTPAPEPEPTPPITTPSPYDELTHPCPGAIITQHWGQNAADYAQFGMWGHNGTDLAAPAGTPVFAIAPGIVAFVGEDADYGIYARIYHPRLACHSFYAHLTTRTAAPGTLIEPGQQIGTVGSTGNSTGPHLHFEIRLGALANYQNGTPMGKGRIDPETFFAIHGGKL